jgi:hypothetical protein
VTAGGVVNDVLKLAATLAPRAAGAGPGRARVGRPAAARTPDAATTGTTGAEP